MMVLNKYQDPFLLAAASLCHKLEGIVSVNHPPSSDYLTWERSVQSVNDDYTVTNTANLIGQFFAWVHILRVEFQFLSIQRTRKTRSLTDPFLAIEEAWSAERGGSFTLWRGQQSAIGELMTFKDMDVQRSCIDYAEFRRCWYDEPEFKEYFRDSSRSPEGSQCEM